jgi:RNA 2',3'-cyclic 3'-phosphodiesterase
MRDPLGMRLFAAVVPPPAVLDHLEEALAAVRAGVNPRDTRGPLRWTEREQRHVTLAFYGQTPEGYVEELGAGLAQVAAGATPFPVALRGAGVFDRRTLWVGVGGDTEALGHLISGAVGVGADLLGRQDERVRSRAHLTIARVRTVARRRPGGRRQGPGAPGGTGPDRRGGPGPSIGSDPAGEVAGLAHALAVYQGPVWEVGEIALVASELGAGPSGGPRHEVLTRYPLGPVAG